MNIRVDLNTPIYDGAEVVFRSPVDCSQVTGLIVYYPENGNSTSKEFAFADAHGNNVGDIDHLFAENVVVKVILDVTTSMAFVQNADTNAYLEGRFDAMGEEFRTKRLFIEEKGVDNISLRFRNTHEAEDGVYFTDMTVEGEGIIDRVRFHGIQDGEKLYDAVNKKQLDAAVKGVVHNGDNSINLGEVTAEYQGITDDAETHEIIADIELSHPEYDGVQLRGLAESTEPTGAVNNQRLNSVVRRIEANIQSGDDSVVESLCPSFEKSGAVVTCEPVVGHPLKVVSHLAELETGHTKAVLHRCGKNLLNLANRTQVTYVAFEPTTKRKLNGKQAFIGITSENHFYHDPIVSYELTETGATFTSRQYGYCVGFDIPVTPGVWYNATCAQNRSLGISFYTSNGTFIVAKTGQPAIAQAPQNAAWALILLLPAEPNTQVTYTDVRVWVGTMNAFEPYKGDYFTADFGRIVMSGSFDWGTGILTDENGIEYELSPQQILGQSGLNTIYSSTGNTEVKGSSDPVAIIDKLTQAIISLGGNV